MTDNPPPPRDDAQELQRDSTGRITSDYEPGGLVIQTARDAICREFGNSGTDGYYIRILKAVYAAMRADQPARVVKLHELRKIWQKHGGDQHGPRVETWTIPEANIKAFFTEAAALLPTEAGNMQKVHSHDMGDGRILTSETPIPDPMTADQWRNSPERRAAKGVLPTEAGAEPVAWAPERMWAGSPSMCGNAFGDWDTVKGHDGDVEYVRADLATPPAAPTDALVEAAQIAGDAFWSLPAPKYWDRDKEEYADWCAAQSKRVREKIAALSSREAPQAVTVVDAIIADLQGALEFRTGRGDEVGYDNIATGISDSLEIVRRAIGGRT